MPSNLKPTGMYIQTYPDGTQVGVLANGIVVDLKTGRTLANPLAGYWSGGGTTYSEGGAPSNAPPTWVDTSGLPPWTPPAGTPTTTIGEATMYDPDPGRTFLEKAWPFMTAALGSGAIAGGLGAAGGGAGAGAGGWATGAGESLGGGLGNAFGLTEGAIGGGFGTAGLAGDVATDTFGVHGLGGNVAVDTFGNPSWVSGFDLPAGADSFNLFGGAAGEGFGGATAAGGGTGNGLFSFLSNIFAPSGGGITTGDLVRGGLSLAGSIFSSNAQANAARQAAGIQSGAAQAGIAAQQDQFNRLVQLMMPYVTAGNRAIAAQQNLIGLGPGSQRAAIRALEAGPEFGELTRQGENAILQNASATGGLRGGNTQASLAQFRPALLSQLINQQFARLGGLTQIGQAAAAGQAAAGTGLGINTANLLGQQGAALAGSELAAGNVPRQVFGDLAGLLGFLQASRAGTGRAF